MSSHKRLVAKKLNVASEDIQFYLAVDNNSRRFFVGKKNDDELWCINTNTEELTIIPNGPESSLMLVGECSSWENEISNNIIKEETNITSSHKNYTSNNDNELSKGAGGFKEIEDINVKKLAAILMKNGEIQCNNWGEYELLSMFLSLHRISFKVYKIEVMGMCYISVSDEDRKKIKNCLVDTEGGK